MKKNKSDMHRVMLAVTETSPLQDLWRAVMEHLAGERAKLITVYVSDDRWRRAASLPFTREISRLSGGGEDFTLKRARQIDRDAAVRTQGRLQQLASDARIQFAFETLAEHETTRIHEFVMSESDVLIAPSLIKEQPIYTELARLKCRILLVDTKEGVANSMNP